MADMAVAVNPADPRYQDLVGKRVWRPFPREAIPVIADAAVDLAFGTGALKITPAHDKLDFEIGQRHGLGVVDALHPNGKVNAPAVPELDGQDRFAARKKAGEMLAEMGLLSKEEPHENNVGVSERSQAVIEPRLSEQWFLRYPKTAEALAVVRDGLIRFFPQHWEKVYAQWLENIRGLVHQPTGVVGAPGARLVRTGRRDPRTDRKSRGGLDPGPGHARYLVFLVVVGLRDDGPGNPREVLSDRRARDRAGHHLLLGGAHDHRRVGVPAGQIARAGGQHPVPQRVLHGFDPRRQRTKDEQIAQELARRVRPHGPVRRGRSTVRPAADRAAGTGHPLRREAGGRRAQLRQQDLERRPFLPDAGTRVALRHAHQLPARRVHPGHRIQAARHADCRGGGVPGVPVQRGGATALQLFLERLLRLVRGSRQVGHRGSGKRAARPARDRTWYRQTRRACSPCTAC